MGVRAATVDMVSGRVMQKSSRKQPAENSSWRCILSVCLMGSLGAARRASSQQAGSYMLTSNTRWVVRASELSMKNCCTQSYDLHAVTNALKRTIGCAPSF